MSAKLRARVLLSGVVTIALVSTTHEAIGFTYVTADRNARVVVHSTGYTGQGGELTVRLGLHPDFAEMEDEVAFSAEHVAAIWTSLLVWEENLEPSLEIPKLDGVDFFGTLIHEFGHTLGLAHPTLIPAGLDLERGVGKFTTAMPGPNGKLDLDEGQDGLRGSADDVRGDDVNAVYFKKSDNNPYTLPENNIVDSTTYSREPGDLPSGDRSPNVSSREVAAKVFSLPSTEGMMVSGGSLIPGQVRRGLTPDDVAGIRYAMSGLDEIQGTSDDYTLKVAYVGVDDAADVMIRFDLSSGFANAQIVTNPLNETHKVMSPNRIINYCTKMAGNRKWYFPQPEPITPDFRVLSGRAVSLTFPTERGARYGVSWPDDALKDGENASEILVQRNGQNRSPMSGRLFLFIADAATSEVKIAFPSEAPEGSSISVFKLVAREAN